MSEELDPELARLLKMCDEARKLARKAKQRAYSRQYRKDHPGVNNAYRRKVRLEKRTLPKPFIGVDGEGAGKGKDHIYWLLRVGDAVKYNDDGSRLNSLDILTWLADLGEAGLNDRFIPVGYFFDYDVTMILRDLPVANLNELYTSGENCLKTTCNHARELHIKNYGFCQAKGCACKRYSYGGHTTLFLDNSAPNPEAHNCLQVMLRHRQLVVRWYKKKALTITDVADFFQTSFLKTIEKWDIATQEQLTTIEINKNRRANFEIGFDEHTFEYNKLECELLSTLMEQFRITCYSNGLYPDMWTGPGRLAEAVFELEKVPILEDLNIPPFISNLCDYAYYGGRAEGIQFGEHMFAKSLDIASAYPWAYTKMPCLLKGHGTWEEVSFDEVQAKDLQNTLVVAHIRVKYSGAKDHPIICGLPMRDTNGNITFPTDAWGCWWYPEVKETLKLYAKENIRYQATIEKCFTWNQTCSDKPGDFTQRWYERRLALGKSTRGIPIKLTLNSLYGKAAQRVGSPKWANPVWAGLLTSLTRARLLEATTILGSRNIISFQTDGIFTLTSEGIDTYTGPEDKTPLGAWEEKEIKDLFLIQSGIYSMQELTRDGFKSVHKTRGMRDFEFEQALPEIRRVWKEDRWFGKFKLPNRTAFITLRLALLWKKPELAGAWLEQEKEFNFYANTDKREIFDFHNWRNDDRPWKEKALADTYAPGGIHMLMHGREYSYHPLLKAKPIRDKNKIIRVANKHNYFTTPYSREIANAWYEKILKEGEEHFYIDSATPLIVSLQEDG